MTSEEEPGGQPGRERSAEAMAEEIACSELLVAACIDEGRASEAVALFSEDATLGEGPGMRHGRRRSLPAMQAPGRQIERRTRHVVTNIAYHDVTTTTATITSLPTLHVLGGPDELTPRALTRFDDVFVCSDDGYWRFAKRVPTLLAGSR